LVSLEKKRSKAIFSVKDSGIGISKEDMKNLFKQGGRGKNSLKIDTHSTGYGLYIARKIIEAQKGRIWAESEGEGKGSTFFVELPS
jgi:signal transduction histidine kinase